MTEVLSERVRSWIDAYNRGDTEAMATLADPGLEWVVAREHPAATTHHGLDAIASYLEDWRQMVPNMVYESEEVLESGNRVLAVGRLHGSGLGSGAGVEVRIATISTFEDGRAVRVEEFLDPEQARKALGEATTPRNGEDGGRPAN